MIEVQDQLGRAHVFETVPERVISLVPSLTELLIYLDVQHRLVGRTKFCISPEAQTAAISVVGGTKQVNFEKIRLLKPDLVLCNKEENTPEMVRELSSFTRVYVSDVISLDDALTVIDHFGSIFYLKPQAQALSGRISDELLRFSTECVGRKPLGALYFIWKNPWMVAGKNTFIDSMLTLANMKNITTTERYPEVDLEWLKRAEQSPELILLSSEPYPFKEKHLEEMQSWFPNARVILVDGTYFSWYGSRIAESFDYFRGLID